MERNPGRGLDAADVGPEVGVEDGVGQGLLDEPPAPLAGLPTQVVFGVAVTADDQPVQQVRDENVLIPPPAGGYFHRLRPKRRTAVGPQ